MSDWGKGAVNNNIGWGQGSVNNTIDWGVVYEVSESGDTDIVGLLPETRLVFSVKTDNAGTSGTNQFTIPTTGSGYSYDIETSDGQTITGNTGNTTITFPSAGTYDVFITGAFPQFYFNNGGDKLKLIELKNFGTYAQGSTSQSRAFWGCSNLVISATDTGYFGSVTDFNLMFNSCSSLTSFPLIDTSSSTSFSQMFYECNGFTTLDLNSFNTSNVTNIYRMFGSTNLTDLLIYDWDITALTGAYQIFVYGSSKISTANYDLTLINWEANLQASFPSGTGYTPVIVIDFNTSKYTLGSTAETARASLISNFGWTITDGGGI